MKKIYIIHSHGDFYKIGIADNVDFRLQQLQCGNPVKLSVIATFESENSSIMEKKIHNILKNRRQSGEWFLIENHQLQNLIGIIKSLLPVVKDDLSINPILAISTRHGIEYISKSEPK